MYYILTHSTRWTTTAPNAARLFGNLETAGIQPAHGPGDGPYVWERTAPADPDVPPRPVLLLHAVAERQRWKAEYTAAQLATSGSLPDNRSATDDQAA